MKYILSTLRPFCYISSYKTDFSPPNASSLLSSLIYFLRDEVRISVAIFYIRISSSSLTALFS